MDGNADEDAAVGGGGNGRLVPADEATVVPAAAAVLDLSAAKRAAMLALSARALALLSTGPEGAGGRAVAGVVTVDVAVFSAAFPQRRFRFRSFALPSWLVAPAFDSSIEGAMVLLLVRSSSVVTNNFFKHSIVSSFTLFDCHSWTFPL